MSGRVTVLTTLFGVVLIGGGVFCCLVLLRLRAALWTTACINQGMWPSQPARLIAAIKANPHDAEAYEGRGSAYVRKGDNERAIADYSEAIKAEPRTPLCRTSIAAWCWKTRTSCSRRYPISSAPLRLIHPMTTARRPWPASQRHWPAARPRLSSTNGSAPASARKGSAPTWANRTSAPAAKTHGPAPAVASSESALPSKRRASAQPLPTRAIAPTASALASSDPASDPAAVETVAGRGNAASPRLPRKSERWTFNGSAITNWISGLRRPSSLRRRPPTRPAKPASRRRRRPVKKPSDNSIIETQEYWNDQMALANGGSSNTRRIVYIERLSELQKIGHADQAGIRKREAPDFGRMTPATFFQVGGDGIEPPTSCV